MVRIRSNNRVAISVGLMQEMHFDLINVDLSIATPLTHGLVSPHDADVLELALGLGLHPEVEELPGPVAVAAAAAALVAVAAVLGQVVPQLAPVLCTHEGGEGAAQQVLLRVDGEPVHVGGDVLDGVGVVAGEDDEEAGEVLEEKCAEVA